MLIWNFWEFPQLNQKEHRNGDLNAHWRIRNKLWGKILDLSSIAGWCTEKKRWIWMNEPSQTSTMSWWWYQVCMRWRVSDCLPYWHKSIVLLSMAPFLRLDSGSRRIRCGQCNTCTLSSVRASRSLTCRHLFPGKSITAIIQKLAVWGFTWTSKLTK